jgi:hypothetical protein
MSALGEKRLKVVFRCAKHIVQSKFGEHCGRYRRLSIFVHVTLILHSVCATRPQKHDLQRVRSLRSSQLRRDAFGSAFFTDRAKTGKPAGGILSDRALAALQAYLAVIGCEPPN